MNGNRYRAMREATGLSLREISRRTGWVEEGESNPDCINPGRLSLIERGLDPTPEEVAILNRILGTLLTGTAA